MCIEWVMPSNYLILCRPLLLLPSIFPSIRIFSNKSALLIRSELTSFRMDWLDLLAVQGTLKSLLQYHSSKASIRQRSAFSIVQLSHPYITNGKKIALTRWTFVGKVMALFFNMLSRLVTEKAMAPHSNTLAWQIPWVEKPGGLQSMGSLRVRHN